MRNIKNLFILFTSALIFVGCLKDKKYDDSIYQATDGSGTKIISLGLNVSAVGTSNNAIVSVDNSTKDTTINLVPVELGGPSAASQDIHVTVGQANNLVDTLNSNNAADESGPTDYTVPSDVVIIDSVITIPKGSRTGFLRVKFVPSTLIGKDVAMGFIVKSVQESGYIISGNASSGVAAIVIKNQYDGIYTASGHMTHPSLGGDFTNKPWTMITQNANTVQFQLNTTALFAVNINLTINSDNSLTITSSDVALDPYTAANNYYDPASKSFHVDFGYSGDTRHITAIATYSSPR